MTTIHPSLTAYYVELIPDADAQKLPTPTTRTTTPTRTVRSLKPSPASFRFHATRNSHGFWVPNTQHGGPFSALMFHCMHRVAESSTKTPTPVRLTVNIYRPVPADGPFEVVVSTIVRTRSVIHLSATVASSDSEPEVSFATAEALFHVGLPGGADPTLAIIAAAGIEADRTRHAPPPKWQPSGEELDRNAQSIPISPENEDSWFLHSLLFQLDPAESGRGSPFSDDQPRDALAGTATWMRARKGLSFIESSSGAPIAPITPTEFGIMIGDVAAGTSTAIDWTKFSYSNVSIGFHWLREPDWDGREHWLLVRSKSRYQGSGAGIVVSQILDSKMVPCVSVFSHLVVKPLSNL